MKKRAKILIAVLCAVATFVPAGLAGVVPEVKAADESINVTASDYSETIYYDLADGEYYMAGSSITVNGENKSSGSTLSIAGDYTITVTSAGGTTSTQNVILYRRGDTHPDGKMDSRDVVALKKYQGGMEISKAGAAAVELTDDVFIDDTDAKMIRKLVSGEIDWKTELPQFETPVNYGSGTNAEMPIGGFLGPALDEVSTDPEANGALQDTRTDAIYQLIADMGVNLIVSTPNKLNSGTSVETVLQSELTLAEQYGIDMYVNASYLGDTTYQNAEMLEQYLAHFGSYSSFKGIALPDEPVGKTFPAASSNSTMDSQSALAKLLHQYTNLTGYTNLFPWWSVNGTEEDYKSYLQEYIDKYDPKQISLDYYVYGDIEEGSEGSVNRDATKANYFKNLSMMKTVADENAIPFWVVCQAGGYFTDERQYIQASKYYPSEGEMKWNVNSALAYGAQGITYYPLIQPYEYSLSKSWYVGSNNNKFDRNGLIGADGNPTKWYGYAQTINTQIQAVDEVLMNAKNQGVMATPDSTAASDLVTTLSTYNELQSVTATGSAGAMAGCFDYKGATALYVVNYDDANAQTVTLNFNGNYSLAVTKAASTSIVNTTGNAYSISLAAGEGVLVLVNGNNGITDTSKVQAFLAAIDALPAVTASEMPRDYTNVMNAKTAFDALNMIERSQISDAHKEKLNALVALTAPYGVVYNDALSVGDSVGTRGVDATYGNITILNATSATKFVDTLVQADVPATYGDVVFYVFNPTSNAVNATYGSVAVSLASNAWTKVTVPVEAFVSDNDLTFASAVSGTWKVTDFYGMDNGDLLQRVIDAIAALPTLATLKLTDKEAVEAVRAMYDALSSDLQANVDNYATLVACEEKIAALEQEAAGKLPIVIDVQEWAYGLDADNISDGYATDATYGTVMTFANSEYVVIDKNQQTDAFKACRSAVVYIYNPTDTDAYVGTQLGDNGWVKRNFVTLTAGEWTRVELFDRGATHTSGDTSIVENYLTAGEPIYFFAVTSEGAASTFAGDGWKISSIYGMNDYSLINVADCDVVVDVTTNGIGGAGTDGAAVTDTTFGTAWSFSSATGLSLNADLQTTEFKLCDDVVTYIYNPTDSAVIMSITTDWDYREFFQLQPKSWNRIIISDFLPQTGKDMLSSDATIWFDPFVFDESTGERTAGTFPVAADGTKWMISNFYGIPSLKDDGSAAAFGALVDALPEANTITMPDDIMWLADIDEAQKAYDSLGLQQTFVDATKKAKLDALVAAIDEYSVVINAKTETSMMEVATGDQNCTGVVSAYRDLAAGAVFKLDITAKAASGSYGAGFLVSKEGCFAEVANIMFSVYNPLSVNVNAEFYGDNWNKGFGTVTLVPGWNKIVLETNSEVSNRIDMRIPMSQEAVGTWLITSIYSVTDEALLAEEVARVELLLQGMPSADDITSLDETDKIESVQNARTAYDALGANTSMVDATLVEKLVTAEAKIAELSQVNPVEAVNEQIAALPKFNELKVSDKEAVRAAETAYNALSETDKASVVGVGKLNACIAKVNVWDELASKIVVDMSYQTLGADGTIALNVDDNTFGKVMTVKNATYIAVTPAVMEENPAYKQSKNIAFYIYNPTDSVIDGNYTIDWGFYGYFQLQPKSWNRIEFSDFGSAANKKMITNGGTVYFYAAMTGEGWKVSSFYGLSATADDITTDDTIVVDASYQTLGCDGTFTNNVDDADFGKVMSVSGATYVAVTPNVMTENPAYKQSKAIAFYIYNPTSSDVDGYYTIDWQYNGYFQLKANSWNRIEIADFGAAANKQMISNGGTVYFYAAFTGEGWKVSNFYSVGIPGANIVEEETDSEAEAIEAVIAQITAVPEASALQLSNKEAVVAAETAYNALSDEGKAQVTNATKLTDCVAKIAELEAEAVAIAAVNDKITALPEAIALKASDKEAVRSAESDYNALSDNAKKQVANVTKLNACIAKVDVWDELAAKTVVDVATQTLGVDGTMTLNVDDNTFGKVMTIKDATYIAITNNVKTEKVAFKQSDNIAFYIYNPTDTDIEGNYTMDWGYYRHFQLKANSWNRIEIADFGSADNKKMITSDSTLYFYAAYAGEGWKVSSFYDMSAGATDVVGETIVIDASYQTLGADGTFTNNVDDADFGKVMTVKDATYIAITNNVKTENAAFKQSDNIAFYIYNPTDTDIEGNYTMDWGYYGHFQLKANSWNRIEIADFGSADNKKMITSDSTLYFYAAYAGEGWKISSFYSLGIPGAE